MKIILSLIIITFFMCIASGQAYPDNLIYKLDSQKVNIPADKIYLHTDRSLYYPADTIFFQSYVIDRFSREALSSSGALYVMLLNSNNEIIDSARFRINIFLSPGQLTLPDTVSPGYYRIVSYTSLMQGYDPDYAFSKWIRVDKLLPDDTKVWFSFNQDEYNPGDTALVTVKVFDKTGKPTPNEPFTYAVMQNDTEPAYYSGTTNNMGESSIIIPLAEDQTGSDMKLALSLDDRNIIKKQSLPIKSDHIDLRFLPEGGTYTFGIPQRLAFNAMDHAGNQLFIKGVVKNDLGEVVDSLKSSVFGPGVIDIIPQEGRSYFAELDEYPGQQFSLPVPEMHDPVIRVNLAGSTIIVEYHNNSGNTDYNLALIQNSQLVALNSLSGLNTKVFTYKLDALPGGIASLILFDKEFNPVAERLIQINPYKRVKAEIIPLKDTWKGGEETELEICLTGPASIPEAGVLSVSVVDSAMGLYSGLFMGNSEDEFLADRQFYRNLPASVKAHGLNNINPAEMNILLLTYGWRKFRWKIMKPEEGDRMMNHYDELWVEILDRLNDRKKQKLRKKRDNMFLLSVEDTKFSRFNRLEDGNYYIPIDSIGSNTSSVMVIPEGSSNNLINAIKLDIPKNSDYLTSILTEKKTPELLPEEKASFSDEIEFNITGESSRYIEEVSVTASRKTSEKFVNQHEKIYRLAPTTTLSGEEIKYAKDFETIMQIIAPNFRNAGLFYVLDGTPLGNDYMMLVDFPPNIIHSVTYLKRLQGYWMYGQNAKGGVIFVETKSNHYGDEYDYDDSETGKSGFGTSALIFRPVAEFYTPTQKEMLINPENSLRRTLYWNPNLIYDGVNPVKIKYPNHTSGTVKVIVNGISENSMPFSQTYTYELK